MLVTSLGFNRVIMVRRLRFFLAIYLGLILFSESTAQNKIVEEVPFFINNGHIIIKIRLNDSAPLNFIFDSGAGATLISKDVSDSLGMLSGARRKNVGVSGEHKVSLIKGIDLHFQDSFLGNINLLSTQTYFEELDNGAKVHGVVGFAILSRYVTEIDNEGKRLLLYNKTDYKYNGYGQSMPIYIVQNLPIIDGNVTMYNGVSFTGQFMVDTGSRSELIISSPTVLKYDIAENIGQHYNLRASIGTSSRRTKMRYGRLASFGISEYDFDDIPVALSSDNKGVLSMEFMDGLIGNRLLQRFNLVFDYQKSVLYLEPLKLESEYSINHTGFTLNFEEGKPMIKNLIDRSPADKAGLRNGDEIISINGVLVENMTSQEIRDSFNKEGETVAIVIKRNNKYKYTEFKPRPLI